MHLLFLYGEGLKVAASSGSSGLPLGKELGSPHVTPTGEPTPLGDVLVRVMRAQLAAYPHACVAPIFFEAAVRYATFFEDVPEYLPEALGVFADQRGLHSPHPWTRSRGSYLLLRFIKSVKSKMAPLVDTVLGALSDLLVIPPPAVPSGSAKGGQAASTFTLDMHLFETVGLLISLEDIPQAKRAEYLQMALAPLFLKAWSAGKPMPAHVPAGWFDEVIRPLAARVCFEMPVQCCDPRDAGTLVLLHEVVSLHRAMTAAQGNQWAEYLLTAYLPSVQSRQNSRRSTWPPSSSSR
ncbi:hypothetical protein AMAG_14958 [Allomyces macrogynus ATCC 38327]|uniref:Exportin-T n=1 Tax=Allomyces macrogynus (strain ATCC 38327) TaxID=578462 RepID=A0A0L0T804_ALLM3|nr:hypothetical protein AMAG_14958 [Allomyces macrogynus ATCC 38327]|eukprot:KNE70850.1 hypothetical protein AMAG_14958 [Allomyces macrogynus ATCC 38327]